VGEEVFEIDYATLVINIDNETIPIAFDIENGKVTYGLCLSVNHPTHKGMGLATRHKLYPSHTAD
jgi:hypothetical protein